MKSWFENGSSSAPHCNEWQGEETEVDAQCGNDGRYGSGSTGGADAYHGEEEGKGRYPRNSTNNNPTYQYGTYGGKRYGQGGRQYGNNNNNGNGGYGGGYNQRRQYNSFNNFRNYGNRRQFQQGDLYQHQHANQYHHNQNYHNNNGYYRQGGQRYTDGFVNYRRNNNITPLSSPEEETLPLPAKRSNWSHDFGSSGLSFVDRNYYGANSRNCSPDNSPTSDISGSFPAVGQTRDVVLNNGSIITAQSLGQYDYFVGNIQNQGGHYSGRYSRNYNFYNYASNSSSNNRESGSGEVSLGLPQSVGPLVALEASSIDGAAPSSRVESCNSPEIEKRSDWPDESIDGGSDTESCVTSASTRCHSPDDFMDIPTLANHEHDHEAGASLRYCNSHAGTVSAIIQKDFSPSQSFCLRMPRRNGFPPPFPKEWFEDLEPEEVIKQFSKVVDLKEKPFNFIVESSFTALDTAIWAKFIEHQQSSHTFRKKVELWRDVYRIVRYLNFTPDFKNDPRNFPFFGLQVVGSTMSGFGSNSSDVDMCLVIRDTEVDQRFEAVDRLQTLSQTLHSLPFVENIEMIYAKVPILKFRDSIRMLDVDLNCNNFVGIRNTHLLYAYAQMDWRLKPLVLIVKLWAQAHGINDAKLMTVSSYSLVLMVIHFLQHGVEQPVLPNLQKEYPEKFNNNVPILSVKIHEIMPPYKSTNQMGLGELLIQFFEYYGCKFDYSRNVISVRTGGTIQIRQAANYKSPKNDFHSWRLLCVEEPFDRTNTARSVYDRIIFDRIIKIFSASWRRLLVNRTLDSIYAPFSEDELQH